MTDDLFLTRLRLQHFRSFAKLDVELKAEPGVMIVQGSNGLGKSSLFHGLEWLLTDQVEQFRLVDANRPPASYLCRWSKPPQEATSVAMTFSDGETLTRELASPKTRVSKFSGAADLVGYLKSEGWRADIMDLRHYLLLTHFLSQSSQPRLSHRDGKERFDILKDAAQSREPERIAKALHGASQTRPARAYRTLRDRLETEAGALKTLLDQEASTWADAQTAGALDDNAAAALGVVIAQLIRSAEGAPEPLEPAADVSPAGLAEGLEAAGEGLDRRALAIVRGRELAAVRRKLQIDLASAQTTLSTSDARLQALPAEEASARAAAERAASAWGQSSLALSAAELRVAKLMELADAVRSLQAPANPTAEGVDPSEPDRRRTEAETRIARLLRRRQIVERLEGELALLGESTDRLAARREAVDQLLSGETRLASLTTALETLATANPDLATSLAATEAEADAGGELVDSLQFTVSAMTAAADAITGAVSVIVTNLPRDACDCPVCATPFSSATELHSRARAAADRLAPEIGRQQARLQEARLRHDTLRTRRDQLRAAQSEIEAAEQSLEEERRVQAGLARSAAALDVPTPTDLEALKASLARDADAGARRIARRRRWRGGLDLGSDGEAELQAAVRARDAAARDLESAERSRADAARRRAWLASEAERLSQELFGTAQTAPAALDAARSAADVALATARERQEAAKGEANVADQAVSRIVLEQADVATRRSAIAKDISGFPLQMRAQDEEWSALGLPGALAPTAAESLSEADDRLGKARARLAEAGARLTRLRDGRVAWSRQGAHRDALERLRANLRAASNHTRDQVREAGAAKLRSLTARIATVSRTKAIAAQASSAIETELNDFNADYIRPLATLMKRINRSILCDPRIGIEFRVDRNSVDQAAVKGDEIPKDRGDIDPLLVHSEGQMAALGVSLLCAASLTFPWSRWKALVLDDPLQHNDAIHAAAFADFVGNLVRARGYQVLLSTHELAQAQFLQRKFRARDIPCTMVTLLGAGADGVEETIEGPDPVRTASA